MGKKKNVKEPMVITEVEYKDVTMRTVLAMAAFSALSVELDDLLKYDQAVIELGDKKLKYTCMVDKHLAKCIKGFLNVLDEKTNTFLGGSEKNFLQAMGLSDIFSEGLDNMKTVYYEAICKVEEEKRAKIHTMNVCYKCGKLHTKDPKISYEPFVAECSFCGDTDVQVMNAEYYQFCGYKPNPAALIAYKESKALELLEVEELLTIETNEETN
jgi:membrane protease subunit (stomatin/prohibitin family)